MTWFRGAGAGAKGGGLRAWNESDEGRVWEACKFREIRGSRQVAEFALKAESSGLQGV